MNYLLPKSKNRAFMVVLSAIGFMMFSSCRSDANKVKSIVGQGAGNSYGIKIGPVPPKSKSAKKSLALDDTSKTTTPPSTGTTSTTSTTTSTSSSSEIPKDAIKTKNGYWAQPEEKYSGTATDGELQHYSSDGKPGNWLGKPDSKSGTFTMNEISSNGNVDINKNYVAQKDGTTGEWKKGQIMDASGKNPYAVSGNSSQKIVNDGFSYNDDGSTSFDWKAIDQSKQDKSEKIIQTKEVIDQSSFINGFTALNPKTNQTIPFVPKQSNPDVNADNFNGEVLLPPQSSNGGFENFFVSLFRD